MPKKTTVLIVLLALVTAVLVFFAISTNTQQTPGGSSSPQTEESVEKTATVYFEPANLEASSVSPTTQSADIMVNTGDSAISGVQAELQFDPTAITNIRLEPEATSQGFFGTSSIILFNDVDEENGRISYAVTISPNQESQQGNGKIATLFFDQVLNTPTATTSVSFLNKTLVTVLGENESVLKDSMPLNITFTNESTTPVSPFVPPPAETQTLPLDTQSPQ